MDNIPAYGYSYSEQYQCASSATLTYDSETRKFSVETSTKNTCYVYFNSTGSSDIITNVLFNQLMVVMFIIMLQQYLLIGYIL